MGPLDHTDEISCQRFKVDLGRDFFGNLAHEFASAGPRA